MRAIFRSANQNAAFSHVIPVWRGGERGGECVVASVSRGGGGEFKMSKKHYLEPQRTFLITINHHRISLQTFLYDTKILHSVLRPIWAPPHNLPPQMAPPSVSPLTLIFIFYHFCKNAFETIDTRQHYTFRTTVFAPVTPRKKFSCFALDPTRPCLHWQLRTILTYQPICDPFKCGPQWDPPSMSPLTLIFKIYDL